MNGLHEQEMATATKDGLQTKQMMARYDDMVNLDAQRGGCLHHGYYGPDEPADLSTNAAAEQRMVEEILKFAGVSDDPSKRPRNIIDVGCGLGGDAVYLAEKYGANCCGINLSPVQIEKATQLAAASGLGDRVSFMVGDALNQPFSDGQFDLVWAMEVLEQIPEKLKFISELARIAAPGATIIFTSCCHRDLSPGETSLKPDEKDLLDKICNTHNLSLYISCSDIVKAVQLQSVHDIKVANFSENVIPYFKAIVQSQRTWKGLISMLLNGWTNFKLSIVFPQLIEAYEKGLIKYTVIACHKLK